MFTTAPASIARTLVAATATTVFAGLCLFGATAPAAASPAADATSVAIGYSDLNLDHRDGRKALDTRIVQTAKSICYNGGRDYAMRQAYADCVATAVASARNQIAPVIASAN
jgi:UrcA family protein